MKYLFVVLLAVLCCLPGKAQQKKYKAYFVANAHLDTQWNWDLQTTISEYVLNTLEQNLFLLQRFPNYVFNFEGGIKYAWMKEYYPEKYELMKEYIRQGRCISLEVAGRPMMLLYLRRNLFFGMFC